MESSLNRMNSPINISAATKKNLAEESVQKYTSAEKLKKPFSVQVIDYERSMRVVLKKGLAPL